MADTATSNPSTWLGARVEFDTADDEFIGVVLEVRDDHLSVWLDGALDTGRGAPEEGTCHMWVPVAEVRDVTVLAAAAFDPATCVFASYPLNAARAGFTPEQVQANHGTHMWCYPEGRCGNCDCRPGGEVASWPCGANVPRVVL